MGSPSAETSAPSTGSDELRLRRSLGAFPTGVCLVTTVDPQGKREGMTINSFASLSLDPPLILWSVRTAARSAASFLTASHFIVNVLSMDQKELALHFARPSLDKFEAFESMFDAGMGGCPRLKACVSTFECRRHAAHEEGDHIVLIGKIERFDSTDLPPLFFHAGRMGSIHELAESSIA
ncbi:flavin reductase family protein [Trinickia terrae]|uniref:Flavin reductase family protein n=1 Tax=Trinickia terrae TaxID=2571161 RepID=A0A4U1IEX5_9BURK|nr:flavin reductase family protein [Trinickia terrae]TKC92263.1 flavin reductase family protein [Trinickia terrae]